MLCHCEGISFPDEAISSTAWLEIALGYRLGNDENTLNRQ